MTLLVLGLIIFIANHSVRIVADGWRTAYIARHGLITWRAIYSVLSLAGLALIIYGYGASRVDPVYVWSPPPLMRYVTAVLVYGSFLLIVAGYVPGNHLRARLGHPMFAGIKIWAFAHLLANGRLGDMLLFGAFMVWAVVGFSAARRRDRRDGVTWPAGTVMGNLSVAALGTLAYGLFIAYLHRLLIGVQPL